MFSSYNKAIDFLFNRLPVFTNKPYPIETFKLEKIETFLNLIGNPHLSFKSIHVAGTNGKGSVSNIIAAVLQQQGYKVGLYTSPHLYDLRERIKLNGINVDANFVLQFINHHFASINNLELTFFEVMVALAFTYFKHEKIDIAVVEVGLGGRLDSTNIIMPILSIITNISLDHTQWLGSTVDKIAFEKAGIIKKGVPVVIGEYDEKTFEVFVQQAQIKNAELYCASNKYKVIQQKQKRELQYFKIQHLQTQKQFAIHLDLLGQYQQYNIITALQAIDIIKKIGIKLSDSSVKFALQNVKVITNFFGRWDVLKNKPLVIADVAHNEAGIRQLVGYIKSTNFKNVHIIIGMVKDKSHKSILNLLPQNCKYYFTQAKMFRALDKIELKQIAASHKLKGEYYDDVNIALKNAIENAINEDLVIVCGSIFLVAELDLKNF